MPQTTENLRGLVDGYPPGDAVYGHAHETDFRNWRGEKPGVAVILPLRDPVNGTGVVHVVAPAPSDEDVDIKQVIHGKSARIARVDSTVSAGKSSAAAKIVAPVTEHFRSWIFVAGWGEATA